MTDERRQDDRRSEDVRLAEEIAELHALLDAEREHARERYADADHGHREIYRLIEVLEGRATMMPSGRTMYEGGLINEVAQLTKKLSNGGIRIKIPVMAWAAIIAAIIAGLFNVWASVVGTIG